MQKAVDTQKLDSASGQLTPHSFAGKGAEGSGESTISVDDLSGRATCLPLPDISIALPFVGGSVATLSRENEEYLLAAPYSSTARSHLFVITLPDGQVEKYPLNDMCAPVILGGEDGDALLGTHAGKVLRVDFAEKTLREIGAAPAGDTLLCGFRTADGTAYFGTATGMVLVVSPGEDRVRIMVPGGAWGAVRTFAELPDGRLFAFAGDSPPVVIALPAEGGSITPMTLPAAGHIAHAVCLDDEHLLLTTAPQQRIFCLSSATWQLHEEWAPLPEDDAVYCLQVVAGQAVASGGRSGAIYGWTGQYWQRLGIPMPYEPVQFCVLRNQCLAGVTYHGHLVQSSTDLCMYGISRLPCNEPDGMLIEAMGIGPERKLYFAPSANMRVGCWDPEEDAVVLRFIASPFAGTVSAIGFAGERLMLGCTDDCSVMTYYPDLPYRLLDNPQYFGIAPLHPARPLNPMVHHATHVYFAVSGTSAGAIIRLNPIENLLATFTEIIPGQTLTSLIVDRQNGLLVTGGQVLPTTAPTSPAAMVALWSPFEERVVATCTPFRDAGAVYAWAAEGGHLYVTDGGERYAILSALDGTVLASGVFPLGRIESLLSTQQGELYGLAGGWFFHFDVELPRIECLTHASGTMLTEVRPGLFAYTHAGRLYKVQLNS